MSINASYPVTRIQPSNRRGGSGGIGRFASQGMITPVVLDVEVPYIFSSFMVSTAGDVVIQDTGDEFYKMVSCQPGTQYWAVGKKIISAGTTATNIYVYGGV